MNKKTPNSKRATKLGITIGGIFGLIAILIATVIFQGVELAHRNTAHLYIQRCKCTAVTHEGDKVIDVMGDAFVIFSDMEVGDEAIALVDNNGTKTVKDDEIIRIFPIPPIIKAEESFKENVEKAEETTVETTEETTVETTEQKSKK